jgi:hypothetical protein
MKNSMTCWMIAMLCVCALLTAGCGEKTQEAAEEVKDGAEEVVDEFTGQRSIERGDQIKKDLVNVQKQREERKQENSP